MAPRFSPEIQVVAEHDAKPVFLQEIVGPDLSVAHVRIDPGIVVYLGVSGKWYQPFRRSEKLAPFEPDVGHDPVPAPRQGLGLAVRLVVDADLDEAGLQSEQAEAGPEVEEDLGLVVRLPEGRAVVEIVELPEGPLRVADPQVDVLAEDVLPELGLEAQLERDLGLDQRFRRVDFLQGRRDWASSCRRRPGRSWTCGR